MNEDLKHKKMKF